jgi:hypothetical protein
MRVASFVGENRMFHWVESVEFGSYLEAEKRKLTGTEAAMNAA